MVFGHTKEQEIFSMLPIGLAKLPEGAAKGVEACGGHIDRTKAAMGCVVWRAELGGPPTG